MAFAEGFLCPVGLNVLRRGAVIIHHYLNIVMVNLPLVLLGGALVIQAGNIGPAQLAPELIT